jgi:hypothetical protein
MVARPFAVGHRSPRTVAAASGERRDLLEHRGGHDALAQWNDAVVDAGGRRRASAQEKGGRGALVRIRNEAVEVELG